MPEGVSDLTVAGDSAYVTGDGLWVLDITIPTRPEAMGHLQMPNHPLDRIVVVDRDAYVSSVFCEFGGCGSTLTVVDVSDPSRPEPVGAWFTKSAVEDIVVFNDVVYLASRQRGVEAVDVSEGLDPSDPNTPRFTTSYGTLGPVVDVVVDSGFAYTSDGAEAGLPHPVVSRESH